VARTIGATLVALCALMVSNADARTGYLVGAAKADSPPQTLPGVYLVGYGIGPVHPAKGGLRPIYARAIAIRDRAGRQVVIEALDLQGHFLAYQQGPYGFADIQADIARRLGIPPARVLIQSTHTHNGPDGLGAWGGVPDSYLAYVKAQAEAATVAAVRSERPARLRFGTANMTGFSGTFGSNSDATRTGDQADYPLDNQLRVLQAVGPRGHVIATLVNYSSHPTVYGPLDKVSPDWPGATATFLEHDERGIAPRARYGYPGSVAIVTTGAVGHAWPAGAPRGTDARVDPSPKSDNGPADIYGNAVARMAIGAVKHPRYVTGSRVAGVSSDVDVANANPVLLAMLSGAAPGYHIMRSFTPPWGYGDVLVTRTLALRIGQLVYFSAPGEAYPSIEAALRRDVHAPLAFISSLADDQLGYIEKPSDYNGAAQCSTTDEWFFTISPTFGADLLSAARHNASALGFRVASENDYGTGPLPPSTNCTQQQAGLQLPQIKLP